ncbi:2424_t:CDS:2, partial [Acaulospora colombiana]
SDLLDPTLSLTIHLSAVIFIPNSEFSINMTSVKPRPSAASISRTGHVQEVAINRMVRFLREDQDEEQEKGPESWGDALANKFYSNLWKEYALCDLKHYKSGNFALRWRTEDEVVSGVGETTCGNTRCRHHDPSKFQDRPTSHESNKGKSLHTLELPFGYVEQGEAKAALVKVVLCDKCVKKIMWKRGKEKEVA